MQEQVDSGLSKKAFCAERAINVATFYYWQRRLDELRVETQVVGFQELHPTREHELRLHISCGAVLIRSRSLAALGRVLKALADA